MAAREATRPTADEQGHAPSHRAARTARLGLRAAALPVGIGALGAASAWLWWRWFAWPYLLPRYVATPLLDLGKIGGYDPAAGRRYTLPLVALWLLYLLAWGLASGVRGERALRALAFAGAAGAAFVLLWLYPITAADIFNYVMYGLVQHRGQNPLVVDPSSAIGPPLIGYSAWPYYPSPYGPLWQGIAWAVTAVTGERLLAGILGFKLVLIACHLLNIALIDRIAAAGGLARPGVAALAYGWNPLILYETAGNGHNDIVMLTGLLLALWLFVGRRRAPGLALGALTLAALAKYVAALWLPVALLAWLPECWRARRWRPVVAAAVGCALLVAVAYLPYWAGDRTLEGVRRQSNLATTSLASLSIAVLTRDRPLSHWAILDSYKLLFLAALALTLALTRPRPGDARGLVQALFAVSLCYLLLGALWFQPWYLVPLVGLLPLVGPGHRAIALAYALGATGSYVFYFYGWPALDWTPNPLVVQSWAVAIAHAPPTLGLLLAAARWGWGRLSRQDAKGRQEGGPI